MKYSIIWQKRFSHGNGKRIGSFLGEVVAGLQFWDKCCLKVEPGRCWSCCLRGVGAVILGGSRGSLWKLLFEGGWELMFEGR